MSPWTLVRYYVNLVSFSNLASAILSWRALTFAEFLAFLSAMSPTCSSTSFIMLRKKGIFYSAWFSDSSWLFGSSSSWASSKRALSNRPTRSKLDSERSRFSRQVLMKGPKDTKINESYVVWLTKSHSIVEQCHFSMRVEVILVQYGGEVGPLLLAIRFNEGEPDSEYFLD